MKTKLILIIIFSISICKAQNLENLDTKPDSADL